MANGDFKNGPFLFDFEEDEHHDLFLEDPFSIEPPQMEPPKPKPLDGNLQGQVVRESTPELRPSHIFRVLDYLYSGGKSSSDAGQQSESKSTDMRRSGKLNWQG
ncbi:MAG: hypothetical protein J5J00_05575 [Deltaproteobacteria bacterium]|nr:hypothetical protein [Deltaproteobacteria bacterium]